MPKTGDSQFSDSEARGRFEQALRSALNTPPKPLKSLGPKGLAPRRKKPKKKAKSSSDA